MKYVFIEEEEEEEEEEEGKEEEEAVGHKYGFETRHMLTAHRCARLVAKTPNSSCLRVHTFPAPDIHLSISDLAPPNLLGVSVAKFMQVIVVFKPNFFKLTVHAVKQTHFAMTGLDFEKNIVRGEGVSCTIQLILQVSRAPSAPRGNSGL